MLSGEDFECGGIRRFCSFCIPVITGTRNIPTPSRIAPKDTKAAERSPHSKPCSGFARAGACCEGGLQEVSAGGRVPIDHLAADEDSREFAEHQVFIELVPADASR